MKYSVVAFFAGLAAAYHAPVGAPSGNAITAPLVQVSLPASPGNATFIPLTIPQSIPAGKPFTIQWTPSTPNKVSLILLKGPSTNAVFNQVIVESIPNDGSFTWTPPTTLEGTAGPGGYGIQLIDDITGQYQYSTQFGISNEKPASSSAAHVSSSAYESPAPKPTLSASGYAVSSSSVVVVVPSSTEAASTSCTTTTTVYAPAPTGASSGAPPPSVIYPTGPVTVPSSLKPTGTGGYLVPTATPTYFPGAASGLQAGLGFAGAVAAFVVML